MVDNNGSVMLKWSVPYLSQLGGLRQYEYLLYNFPYACKYDCIKCCNHDRKHLAYVPEAELEEIIRTATGLGFRVFGSMGFGEPLISRGFEAAVDAAVRNQMGSYFFSTAFDLDLRKARFLGERDASLIVQIASLNAERYHRICGGRSNLGTVLRNLETALPYFITDEKLGGHQVTRIAVNMVISKLNIADVTEVAKFAENNQFAFVANSLLDCADPDYLTPEAITAKLGFETTPLGTSEEGICEYLRRGITIQGDKTNGKTRIIATVCPYLDIEVGQIDEKSIASQTKKGWLWAIEYYARHGNARCIARKINHDKIKSVD